jgi:uncharacterized protein
MKKRNAARESGKAALIREIPGGVLLQVRVQPRASRSEIAGIQAGMLRVRLAAAPVEGAANEELVRFLAHRIQVPKSVIRIISGLTSRTKLVSIGGSSLEEVHSRLGI